MRPKLVIDRYIPFIQGVIEPYADVRYLAPADIDAAAVADADGIIIRTRTRVDGTLLAGARCRFAATATIGMDHFDKQWCADNDMSIFNAPGCNAPAVAQYVMASLANIVNRPLSQHTIAIVGVGHVGSIVERWARALDMTVLRVDPPRQRAEGGDNWHTLADAAHLADIITFHTPLTRTGDDATWHLGDKPFFDTLARTPIIINSSRGPVVDNTAWADAIESGKAGPAIVDVWEHEPAIDQRLLALASIATPHIAGYSMDGKIRATAAALDAVSQYFGLPAMQPATRPAVPVPHTVSVHSVMQSYDPLADTAALRHALATATDPRATFEHLRDTYTLRPEALGAHID